jgi:pyruvate formate lyase activating enzyme
MARHLTEPAALWWNKDGVNAVRCHLCPHHCRISEGERGFCRGRMNEGGHMRLDRWKMISGLSLDPIEKKPLYHFLPGTQSLSFGTAGCNLACRYCQNHPLSMARDSDPLSDTASPTELVATALSYGARSISFTYNEPIIFAEYAIAVAEACHASGLAAVAVTNGYVNPEPALAFFSAMDAANVDLKGYTEAFYREYCSGTIAPVLETLRIIRRQTTCHLEITTLIIPGLNDSEKGVTALGTWIANELGPEVPLHLSAFHPAWEMKNLPPTPPETLLRSRLAALDAGLRFVYTGNIHDPEGSTTNCPACGELLIARQWFAVRTDRLSGGDGYCPSCGARIPGVFR